MNRARCLIATAALGALALTACTDDRTASDPGASDPASPSASPSASATPSDPASSQPTAATSSAASGAPAQGVAAPLYFVGDTPQGPRLYREFQQVEADDPLLEAVLRLVAGQADDPDYRTLLTGLVVDEVAAGADGIVVTVEPGDGAFDDLTRRQQKLAAQQLVYTVQGAAQSTAPVFVRLPDGSAYDLGDVDTSAGLTRAKELNVLALVNVTSPEQGATVSGGFTAEGLASSFEAAGPWQLLAADGTVVKEGGYQAEGWMDKLYPWTAEVDLSGVAPGDYTFVARTDDPTGGTEGPGPDEDTKQITVK